MSEIHKKNVAQNNSPRFSTPNTIQPFKNLFPSVSTISNSQKQKRLQCPQETKVCELCKETSPVQPQSPTCNCPQSPEPKLASRQPLIMMNGKTQRKRQNSLPSQIPEVVYDYGCNECDAQIKGIRYHCPVCPDYDACEQCYGKVKHTHELEAKEVPCRHTVMSKDYQKQMLLNYMKTNVRIKKQF